MSEYKDYYRVLDCWQCFLAKGRMCHHARYESLLFTTKSGNKGLGICCNPSATNDLCDPLNEDLTCSEKSYDPYPTKMKEVMSKGDRNH